MRGVDTNVLLRFITFDDQVQSPLAESFFERAEQENERLFVATVVLCELVWTLKGPRYRYDNPSIVAVLQRITEMTLFEVESRQIVQRAVAEYRESNADFADFLIGQAGSAAGCTDTVTFDRRLSHHAGFSLLE